MPEGNGRSARRRVSAALMAASEPLSEVFAAPVLLKAPRQDCVLHAPVPQPRDQGEAGDTPQVSFTVATESLKTESSQQVGLF